MPDFSKWGVVNDAIDATSRAVSAWNRITHNPISLVITRAGIALSAQTVRVEQHKVYNRDQTALGEKAQSTMTVFGVVGHPTQADTDIKRGDRFLLNDQEYMVVIVRHYPGEVQAQGEVQE